MKNFYKVFIFMILFLASFGFSNAGLINYTHPEIEYTSNGLTIYGGSSTDFMNKGFAGQVKFIKDRINGKTTKYILGTEGDILGTEKNDYFYGFNHYRKNNLVGGAGDDFYDIQHTYRIIEEKGGGTDTYIFGGNSGYGQVNVENFISRGGGGRVYGTDNDDMFITEGLGSEVHGGKGNDIFIINGLKNSYYGDEGIDTAVFKGPLSDYIIAGDPWGVTVKNIKNNGVYRIAHHSMEQFQFDDAFFGYEAGINILEVGPNKTFKKVMDALHVAGDGDIIEVESGVYINDFAIINRDVTIKGVNGKAHFVATKSSFKGKANFIVHQADVTFDNVEFSGNKVSDLNGAGIRYEGGILTIKNSYFHNNQVGILGGSYSDGIVNIENTEFGYNGIAKRHAHTLNLGNIKELNIKNSFFHNSINSHNIRTAARTLVVKNSFFYDGTSDTHFNIENHSSEKTIIKNNTFIQSDFGENHYILLDTASISSDISGNIFVNNSNLGVNAIKNSGKAIINLNDNKLYNYKGFVTGKNQGGNNIVLEEVSIEIPSSTISVGDIVYNNKDLNKKIEKSYTEFTSAALELDYKGKKITVGAGKDYTTLRSAVSNAGDGDRIYVDEGVYESDYVYITNKNIAIIGLGNGAEFRKVKAISNGKAIFVANKSNLLVKNIKFTNSDVPDRNGAGIRYEIGGTLTVRNCTFSNNENGILGGATPKGKGKIWIYDSLFLNNGKNGSGYTHAIYIGEIDSFEIKNTTVSGTSVGHHVKSRARKNIIENNILDDDGKNASYNIDLPNGGEALVKGNRIVQSAASLNRTLLSYSAEKKPTNPGKLTVENNVFISYGSNATGIKNFKNNEVILINNTFTDINTPYVGNNIKVITEKVNEPEVIKTPEPIIQDKVVIKTEKIVESKPVIKTKKIVKLKPIVKYVEPKIEKKQKKEIEIKVVKRLLTLKESQLIKAQTKVIKNTEEYRQIEKIKTIKTIILERKQISKKVILAKVELKKIDNGKFYLDKIDNITSEYINSYNKLISINDKIDKININRLTKEGQIIFRYLNARINLSLINIDRY